MGKFSYNGSVNGRQGNNMNTILLIEDDPRNARLIIKILAVHGYNVIHTEDAVTGLQMAREQQPDLILLDIGLPDLDGKVVANSLKLHNKTSHIPIIAVTADNSIKTQRLAIAFGCRTVIHKPIDTRLFAEQIAQFLPTIEYQSKAE